MQLKNTQKLMIFIKGMIYTHFLILLLMYLSYLFTGEYDDPILNFSALMMKNIFLVTFPLMISLLWIIKKGYTQKDAKKVVTIIFACFLTSMAVVLLWDIPFYEKEHRFSGGWFITVVPIFVVPKLLPKV